MTRKQQQAIERLKFAKELLVGMTPEQREVVTEDRLIMSCGVSRPDAAILIKQHCGR